VAHISQEWWCEQNDAFWNGKGSEILTQISGAKTLLHETLFGAI
jgi:hypothetical protein